MSEAAIMRRAMLALSKAGAVIFRNNVAQGVVGRIEWIRAGKNVWVTNGDAVVRGARVLQAGLFKGSGDLIGWTPVVITQEMVGRTLAVFTSVETKDAGGRKEPEQIHWADQVRVAGGLAGFAYSPDEAVAIVRGEAAK